MNKLARFILQETTWGTAKCTCLSGKSGKLSINKKSGSLLDPPEITNEIFAGTNLSSAADAAGLRGV